VATVEQTRYRAKLDGGTYSRALTLEQVQERWGVLAHKQKEPFRFKVLVYDREEAAWDWSDEWGPFRKFQPAYERLPARLKDMKVGNTLLTDTDHRYILIRKVKQHIQLPDSPGTEAIDIIRWHLYRQFPQLESWGICNCRLVAGTWTWSQHAYCNAEDVHASSEVMLKAANYLKRKGQGGVLPVGQVIHNRRVWEPGYADWRAYGGINPHTDHVHYGGPNKTGTPECARGRMPANTRNLTIMDKVLVREHESGMLVPANL
jgi:hypothetical protein